ncbi:MAG: hypothetical protein EBZ59_01120 [Planctomycetia bacterium]|nr:hypothetical protein [Planctomycetia bacterium]
MERSAAVPLSAGRRSPRADRWPHVAVWATALAGIAGLGLGAASLLDAQGSAALAGAVRLATLAAAVGWSALGLFRLAEPAEPWRPAAVFVATVLGGAALAEFATRSGVAGASAAGLAVQVACAAASVWWTWRVFNAAPRWRAAAVGLAALLGAAAVVWFLVRDGRLVAATGLAGVTGMAAGCVAGLWILRAGLAGSSGIAGIARTVLDEAVRMRVAVGLLVLLVVLVPTLPLLLDHSERLAYRVQFFLSWSLGGTGFILAMLTIFLACGSVCGDIDSNRIHMTLSKPVSRLEYLVGKWLGIVAFNLFMVALAGAGTYTFLRVLAGTQATDGDDRRAVDRQVLTARVDVRPEHENPAEFAAAVSAALDQLEKDEPDAFRRNAAGVRARIGQEYEWIWHTVTPDKVSTYIFRGLPPRPEGLQLQLKPRVNNVEVDLADVRFALWINDRPWPVVDGVHVEQTLPSLAVTTLDVPGDVVNDAGTMKLTVANRNLVPPGETQPTAIQFAPGDGMKVLFRVGGFDGNYLRCLAIIWIKLAMVAAAAVVAAALLGLPTAMLLSLVVYFSAVGSGFLRDALSQYNVVADTALGAAGRRLAETAALAGGLRFYEAGRMLLGFVTDIVLWLVPAFSDYDAVARLATGIAIPPTSVLSCLAKIGLVYPLLIGLLGWLVFDRRDLVRSSS